LPRCAEDEAQAKGFAEDLQLPVLPCGDPRGRETPGLVLCVHDGRASLCLTGRKAPGPLEVDFSSPALARRVREGISQSLTRACGLRSGRRPRILDATAGLGRDAYVLAALGSEVTMVERHPVLHLLLDLALGSLMADASSWDRLVHRNGGDLLLRRGDATELLREESKSRPDVIYLDPMFPARRKSALVKKEMQILHALLGDDGSGESEALLESALVTAQERVVVKRPRISEPLGGREPDQRFLGRSHRYDLYVVRRFAPGH
jgi:16S rRNA (guanine1516-N2)-methyltransferase